MFHTYIHNSQVVSISEIRIIKVKLDVIKNNVY